MRKTKIDEYAETIARERQSKPAPLMKTHNTTGASVPDAVARGYFGVASDVIHSLKWIGNTMTVRFRNGSRYLYHDVPRNVFDVLRASPSVGRAFDTLVKQNGYAFEKIT